MLNIKSKKLEEICEGNQNLTGKIFHHLTELKDNRQTLSLFLFLFLLCYLAVETILGNIVPSCCLCFLVGGRVIGVMFPTTNSSLSFQDTSIEF